MTPLFALLMAARIVPPAPGIEYRQPQIAVHGSAVALAFGSRDAIWVALSRDGGASFSAPVKAAEVTGLMLGRHRGPRIAFAGTNLAMSAIALPDGNLSVWRSADGGNTWRRAGVVNDVPRSAREGLHAMAGGADGTLLAAWLDLRSKGARLYASRSTDSGARWSPNTLVYESPSGTICECCHPSAALDASGRAWLMWRNWLDGNRDMYLSSAAPGEPFGAARKLGAGNWPLNACPMDGGGLAVADSRIVTAWRRASEVFLDEPGAAETPIGNGKDPALALTARGAYAVWTDSGAIMLRTPDGATRTLGRGGFPVIAALPGGAALAVWEDAGAIAVEPVP